jgi:general stress protein YciG
LERVFSVDQDMHTGWEWLTSRQWAGGSPLFARGHKGTIMQEQQGDTKDTPPTTRRGFAAMSAERQREIASKGGRAAHSKGTAHHFSPDEARAAGRKGGQVVSRDREHMSRIGREGGRRAHMKPDDTPSTPPAPPESETQSGASH